MGSIFRVVTELDGAKESGLKYTVCAHDLVLDLKSLIKDFYTATIRENGCSLKLCFNNGQHFTITIEETKE